MDLPYAGHNATVNGPRWIDGVQRFDDDDPVNVGDPIEALDLMLWETELTQSSTSEPERRRR